MLTGNKFYTPQINAQPLSGEVNYTDWGRITPLGSSYTSGRTQNPAISTSPSTWSWDKYKYQDVPVNNPYKTIDNYNTTLHSVGEVAPQRKGAGLGSALMTVLDLMQRPQYMVTNVLQDLTDKKQDKFVDVLSGALQGLAGTRKSSFTDTLDNLGWENDASKKWYQGDNLARNVVGFAGDVLLDPTTYLSAGTLGLAKGVGTKSVKEGMEQAAIKTLSKSGAAAFDMGTDAALKMSKTDVANELISIFTKPGKDITEQLANRKVATELIEKSAAKHGKQSDFILRLAHTLAKSADNTTPLIAERTMGIVDDVLDKGLGALNKDVVSQFSTPLQQELGNLLAKLPDAQTALSRSAGQIINKKLGKDFSLTKRLSMDAKTATIQDIGRIFSEGKRYFLSKDEKLDLVKTLFDKTGKVFDKDFAKYPITQQEYDLMDTLIDAFGGDLGDKSMDALYVSVMNLADKTTPKAMDRIIDMSKSMGETLGNIKRLENGVEFSNGLQRVFDATEKSFFLRYHNPFTNTIKPIIELTNAAQSDIARKAWSMVAEGNLLKPVVDKVADVASGVAKKFGTEVIDKRIAQTATGMDWDKYVAATTFSRKVTEFMRKENAIPRSALSATKIFKNVPEFFQNEGLRKSASFYLERNNSPMAKATWLYLSGEGLTDMSDDALVRAYDLLVGNADVVKKLDAIGYKPEYFESIKKAAAQNKMFNEAIAQFDGANKIEISDSLGDYTARAARGEIDDEALSGYARIYRNTPDTRVIAESKGNIKDIRGKADDTTRSGKFSTVDVKTGSATSTKTGAFYYRENASLADAMLANPLYDYEMDLATRVARRTMESERVALNKQFIDTINDFIKNEKGFNKLVSNERVDGFKMVPLMDGEITLYAHPEIANQLYRVTSVFDSRSVQEAAVDEMLANTTNLLKTFQTKYNPSFILRNAVGEPLMNWIAGVSPKAHSTAADIMRTVDKDGTMFKIGNTTFADLGGDTQKLFREYVGERPAGAADLPSGGKARILEDASGARAFDDPLDIDAKKREIIGASGVEAKYYQIGDRQMTAQQIMDEFYEVGLGWSGITKGNEAKNMRGLLEQEMLEISHKSGFKGAVKTLHQKAGIPGDAVETWTRLSHYIDSLNKGMDIQGAATEVRKFHVDYKDLTKFEREKLRSILPYYTYMRKNTPIQFKLLLERQNKINVIGQLVDSAYEAVQRDNRGEPLAVPDYLKEGLAIPIGVDENTGEVRYLNWGIPVADVGRLKYDLKEMLTENFFSMLSPMIKAPLEYSMNKNMMYGSDLEGYAGETSDLLPNVAGSPQISTIADQLLQQLGVVNNARGALAAGISANQQGENGIAAGLEKFFVGGFSPKKSQEDVKLQQAYDYRDQLYAHIQKLRAQGVQVPQYTPSLQHTPNANYLMGAGEQLTENNRQGYLGVSTDQLFPKLLKLLTGQ